MYMYIYVNAYIFMHSDLSYIKRYTRDYLFNIRRDLWEDK